MITQIPSVSINFRHDKIVNRARDGRRQIVVGNIVNSRRRRFPFVHRLVHSLVTSYSFFQSGFCLREVLFVECDNISTTVIRLDDFLSTRIDICTFGDNELVCTHFVISDVKLCTSVGMRYKLFTDVLHTL